MNRRKEAEPVAKCDQLGEVVAKCDHLKRLSQNVIS
jgi:hypothetical protein